MTSPALSAPGAQILPDYVPVPRSSLGPAVNDQGYYVGRVERNLYWVTDGYYHSAFLTTWDGVVLFDAPPSIGHNLQRAVNDVAAAEGCPMRWPTSSTPTTTPTTLARPRCSGATWSASGMRRPGGCCCGITTRPSRRRKRPSPTTAPSRSAASASSLRGTAPTILPTTITSTFPTTATSFSS